MSTSKLVTAVSLLLFSVILIRLTAGDRVNVARMAGAAANSTSSSNSPKQTLEVWAPVDNAQLSAWRLRAPIEAAKLMDPAPLIRTKPFYSETEFTKAFVTAAEAGDAPDIIFILTLPSQTWIEAGYLAPLDDCRAQHAEFDDVRTPVWRLATYRDRVWAVPIEQGIHLLFFNKDKLAALGWSETEIEALPGRINRGSFTLEDLIATAKAAIDQGIVEPGFGYWSYPGKSHRIFTPYRAYGGQTSNQTSLVIDRAALVKWYRFQRRLIMDEIMLASLSGSDSSTDVAQRTIFHDTVTRGRVLFWFASIHHWADWATIYTPQRGGHAYLEKTIGAAAFPSIGLTNQKKPFGIFGKGFAVTSPQASGRRQQQAACDLLAKMTTPRINTAYATTRMVIGVLNSQLNAPVYRRYPLLSHSDLIIQNAPPAPEFQPPADVAATYLDILWQFMLEVEQGSLTPEEGAAMAVERLQQELGEAIRVQ